MWVLYLFLSVFVCSGMRRGRCVKWRNTWSFCQPVRVCSTCVQSVWKGESYFSCPAKARHFLSSFSFSFSSFTSASPFSPFHVPWLLYTRKEGKWNKLEPQMTNQIMSRGVFVSDFHFHFPCHLQTTNAKTKPKTNQIEKSRQRQKTDHYYDLWLNGEWAMKNSTIAPHFSVLFMLMPQHMKTHIFLRIGWKVSKCIVFFRSPPFAFCIYKYTWRKGTASDIFFNLQGWMTKLDWSWNWKEVNEKERKKQENALVGNWIQSWSLIWMSWESKL